MKLEADGFTDFNESLLWTEVDGTLCSIASMCRLADFPENNIIYDLSALIPVTTIVSAFLIWYVYN